MNCDAEFVPESRRRVLFCSDVCRETAKVVRYLRKAHGGLDGDQRLSEDVQLAIKIKVAFAIHGGYPRHRQLTEETRAAVFERDANRCHVCGEPGEEIHHLTSAPDVLNDISNLRTVCHTCHLHISYSSLVPATKPEVVAAIDAIYDRALAPEPIRPCDDEFKWEHERKQHETERRARLIIADLRRP